MGADDGVEGPRLTALLARAATDDRTSFLQFFDHTAAAALRLEFLRVGDADQAEADVRCRYFIAWRRCGEQAGSGLSPVAWLLSLQPSVRDPAMRLGPFAQRASSSIRGGRFRA